MQERRNAAVRLLRLMLASTIVLPAALFGYVAFTSYGSTFKLADERIERSLDAVDEHATKVFQSVNVTIASADAIVKGRPDEQVRAAAEELHRQLAQIVKELPTVNALWMFDRNGRALVTSYAYPTPSELDVSKRDYFLAHVERDSGTFVGQVITPIITTSPFFAVSRRRTAPDGSFAGVIVVSVLPADFYDFYERLARQKGTNYTMVRPDGVVLARYPGPVISTVRLDANSGFMKSIAQNPESGWYTTISQVDFSERRIAIRRLRNLPLYISTGLGVSDIREEWRNFLISHLFFGIPATMLLFALVWLTLKRTESLYQEAERRLAAEETLRQAQKMEVVGQLTGGVAHDFNNLLTIIIGNLEIALRRINDASIERVLRNALTGGQRAAQLTQRLLAFSRRQPLSPRKIDANKLVTGMSDLLRRSLGEQIEIETVSGAGLWPVEADPAELEAAILNLAVNARDAMPQGGKLTIETTNAFLDERYARDIEDVVAGPYVLIAVTDTGRGMPQAVLDRVFEPFFTTKESGQGTGLGLSQVYGFTKQSKGHVRIYSEIDHGTTVKMYLPRGVGVETEMEKAEPSPELMGRGETILVVEDDDDVRSYVAEVLGELGYRVLSAAEGTAALALVDQPDRPIDLLLTDVILPGMNGRQLADTIQARRPSIRVLFMSGYSRNAIVHHGRLDRGVALIQKPLSRESLANKVREVLDGASAKDVPEAERGAAP